jgi:hypothetical protein
MMLAVGPTRGSLVRQRENEREGDSMKSRWIVASAFTFSCLALMRPGTVLAHHAFSAEFDANKPITLRGTVAKVEWINPHSWIHVDVKNPNGKVDHWMIEGGNPTVLLRRGFTKQSLPAGTEIIVEGYRAKGNPLRANGRDLTLPNGQKLFMGSSGTGAPQDGRDPTEKK